MKILVTGAAGFIGSTVCRMLLDNGIYVVGLDNINDYYDPALKYNRLSQLGIVSYYLTARISGWDELTLWPYSNTRDYGHIKKVLRGQDP